MYKEEVLDLTLGEHHLKLIQITNVDEIFDELIRSEDGNEDKADERIPYWTELWPSAIALSRFIIDHALDFKDKNIIELGAGLALPSLTASFYSQNVLCTDYLLDAVSFAKKNAQLNGIEHINFDVLDWRQIPPHNKKYDIILASDIAYEKRFFDDLPVAFLALMDTDSVAILSEPGRAFTQPFIESLHKVFEVEKHTYTVTWRGTTFTPGVFLFRRKSEE